MEKKCTGVLSAIKQINANLELGRWIIYGVGRETGPNPTTGRFTTRGQGRAEERVRRPLYR